VHPVLSYDQRFITMETRLNFLSFGTRLGVDIDGRPMYEQNRTQVETYLTLPDGGTILAGGIVLDERTMGSSKVPILTSVPIFGRLFRAERQLYERSNVLMVVHARRQDFED